MGFLNANKKYISSIFTEHSCLNIIYFVSVDSVSHFLEPPFMKIILSEKGQGFATNFLAARSWSTHVPVSSGSRLVLVRAVCSFAH